MYKFQLIFSIILICNLYSYSQKNISIDMDSDSRLTAINTSTFNFKADFQGIDTNEDGIPDLITYQNKREDKHLIPNYQEEKQITIRQEFAEAELRIAPNPTSFETNIYFSLPETGQAILTLYDINGKIVTGLRNRQYDKGQQKLVLETGGLVTGTYFLQFQGKGFVKTEKLIVIK